MTLQDETKSKETPMCSELRCKGMFVAKQAMVEEFPEMPSETAHWWCELTQYSIGPDRDWVHRSVCTPSRTCYRAPGNPA